MPFLETSFIRSTNLSKNTNSFGFDLPYHKLHIMTDLKRTSNGNSFIIKYIGQIEYLEDTKTGAPSVLKLKVQYLCFSEVGRFFYKISITFSVINISNFFFIVNPIFNNIIIVLVMSI